MSRDKIIRVITDYGMQENVSIEEAEVIARFCGELLKFENKIDKIEKVISL